MHSKHFVQLIRTCIEQGCVLLHINIAVAFVLSSRVITSDVNCQTFKESIDRIWYSIYIAFMSLHFFVTIRTRWHKICKYKLQYCWLYFIYRWYFGPVDQELGWSWVSTFQLCRELLFICNNTSNEI